MFTLGDDAPAPNGTSQSAPSTTTSKTLVLMLRRVFAAGGDVDPARGG
jgi:hypothetical protein